MAGCYGFTLDIRMSGRLSVSRLSVRPSVFRFRMITGVNINGFSSNLVCALILWISGLWLLMGKFWQSCLPKTHPYFHFWMIMSKHQWIFMKLGLCIDIVETWIGIANGQISSNFYGVNCPRYAHIFISGHNLSKSPGSLTRLGTCIDMKEIWFGIANGQMSSMFDRVICPQQAGHYSLTFIIWTEGSVLMADSLQVPGLNMSRGRVNSWLYGASVCGTIRPHPLISLYDHNKVECILRRCWRTLIPVSAQYGLSLFCSATELWDTIEYIERKGHDQTDYAVSDDFF